MTPYYIITLITDSASTSQTGAITVSELRKRIDMVINLRVRDGGVDWSWEEAEDIILNGEKEQPWPGPNDILEMRGKEQPPAGLFHGPGLPKKETDKEYCICGKQDHPLQPTEEAMTPDPGPEWFRQQIKDPQCQAEALLLDLTEKIVEIHGQYRGRYYWLWRLLEWTATKLIWRRP